MKKVTIKDKIEGNELDLSLNGLSEVPVQELASAPKATHLDLSCNEIRLLPNNFASLTHLVKIDLSKNFLTELPHNFGSLTNLAYLDLYGNRLATLPLSFCRLKNLKWLDLKNNPLNPGLKQIAGDCLDQKQCQKCAKDIVVFMQSMESEMERQKQKRLKEEREKEAARMAKEQEELAEQRRLKKAERERRKAEAKARRLANQQNQNEKLQSSEHGNAGGMSKESRNMSMSKSGSCWRTCCFTVIMVPILFVVFVVSMRLLHGYRFESLSSFVEETHLELKEALEVWWNAFALPHLLSMKMSLQNWFHSVS